MHDEYMRGLRQICDEEGIVLIYDEVVSGWRVGLGGASQKFDITPDLVCMGKAIGNGFPVAAVAGKRELMSTFNTVPGGTVAYQATYYGHPVMAAAAVATIEELEKPGFYEKLAEVGDYFADGMRDIANRLDIELDVENCGSLIGVYFCKKPFNNYDELLERVDAEASDRFRHMMIERGHYIALGTFKRLVTTAAHTKQDIAQTLETAEDVLREIYKK